jgi:acyl carrier protein
MSEDTRAVADVVLREVAKSFCATNVALEDKFAELRANSVSVVRLTSALQNRYGISIDIVEMLSAVTVRDLVILVERLRPQSPAE